MHWSYHPNKEVPKASHRTEPASNLDNISGRLKIAQLCRGPITHGVDIGHTAICPKFSK